MDFLLIFNSAILGLGLAMDAFSVSLANGLDDPCMRKRKMYGISAIFGTFQGLMPLIGWLLVHTLAEMFNTFQAFIPWIALGLLSFIGAKMLFDGVGELKSGEDKSKVCTPKQLSFASLIIQGIATSIDALSVGFTISEYNLLEALAAALIIAAITFVICLGGVIIGRRFGTALAGKSAIFGGVILIVIGIEIFVTSFI
ncbi:MAG: manganese efflux pump [Clostridia bacterium]|nr:manganese efflux pump [Clostridia bacterium]